MKDSILGDLGGGALDTSSDEDKDFDKLTQQSQSRTSAAGSGL
jgi:hypothetical protein